MTTPALRGTPLPRECANQLCPNKVHEGQFVIAEAPPSGNTQGLRLLLCAPCWSAHFGEQR